LVSSGEATWFDYAKHVLAQAYLAQTAIKIIANDIAPARVRQFTPDFPVDFQLNQRLTAGFRNSCGGTFY
jgi:hypothetical protein